MTDYSRLREMVLLCSNTTLENANIAQISQAVRNIESEDEYLNDIMYYDNEVIEDSWEEQEIIRQQELFAFSHYSIIHDDKLFQPVFRDEDKAYAEIWIRRINS